MKHRSFRVLRFLLVVIVIAAAAQLTALAETNISSVSITLDAPVIGAHPDYTAEFPSGANYYSYEYNTDYYRNDIVWHYRPNGPNSSVMLDPDDDVFQAGNSYIVDIYLTARDGYSFTDSTTATFNGEDGSLDYDYAEETGQFFIRFTFPILTEPEPMTFVSVTLDAPVVGEYPDFTAEFPSGAHYYSAYRSYGGLFNDVGWYDETADMKLEPGSEVFQFGHEYTVSVYLSPKFGYEFTDDTSAVLNGQTPSNFYLFDGQLVIRESFPPLADVTRGDVNLDGKVDAADLTVLARHVAGISFLTDPQALSNADVTGEGGISASDLTKLARFVAHIEDEL